MNFIKTHVLESFVVLGGQGKKVAVRPTDLHERNLGHNGERVSAVYSKLVFPVSFLYLIGMWEAQQVP